MSRRTVLSALGASVGVSATGCANNSPVANDISQLEPTYVSKIIPIGSVADVQYQMNMPGWVSAAGGRFSMGGQTSASQTRQLNFDPFNRVVDLDVPNKVVRVQAGMRWRDVQDVLDPHNLSVKVMQSFSNFSVGGSVSVNCHGRYVNAGSISHTVRSLQMVLPTGEVVEASRSVNPHLFSTAIGGYGLIGAITEVELDVCDNVAMERTVEKVPLMEYPDFFEELKATNAVMHNADLFPPDFNEPVCITYNPTIKRLTDDRRLLDRDAKYSKEQNAIFAFTELPGGYLSRVAIGNKLLAQPKVVMRNLEASLDVASLEPRTRFMSTYLLQEYFIPVRHFQKFAKSMADILKQFDVNALNVSIRHAPQDNTSVMRWANEEVFCFVLYYKQRRYPWSDTQTVPWTRALIDAALQCNGRYYLPYRPHATREQFIQAYPQVTDFIQIKQSVDPNMRMTNHLWQRYMNHLV